MISFQFTTDQVRARTKTVTRREGWQGLRPGTELLAVEKAMGLRKGEHVKPICVIRVISVRRERLDEIVAIGPYGPAEMALEGFPGLDPQDFLFRFFARSDLPDPSSLITRIQFEYV